MTMAYSCVLLMIIFPYFFTTLAKFSTHFNNHKPREYLDHLTGWRKRANYVQLNSFEVHPAFGIAVIIAHLIKTVQFNIDVFAITFVVSRICYAICYLSDQASLRSLFWFIGMACIVGLLLPTLYS